MTGNDAAPVRLPQTASPIHCARLDAELALQALESTPRDVPYAVGRLRVVIARLSEVIAGGAR